MLKLLKTLLKGIGNILLIRLFFWFRLLRLILDLVELIQSLLLHLHVRPLIIFLVDEVLQDGRSISRHVLRLSLRLLGLLVDHAFLFLLFLKHHIILVHYVVWSVLL